VRVFLATRFLALSLVLSGWMTAAHAYPIFYKCDKDRLLSEVITGEELDKKLRIFLAENPTGRPRIAFELCQGNAQCSAQLQQIASLVEIDRSVTEALFAKELNALEESAPASPLHEVSSESYELEKRIRASTFEVAACRNTMMDLSAEKFVLNAGSGDSALAIYFPYYSEYTYVTGCRRRDQIWVCDPNRTKGIQDSIRKALLVGADPYTYLSIGLMEGGPNGWEQLYLDPIGQMAVMGCQETKGSVSTAGKDKLHSYGNYHKIQPGLVQMPGLSNRLSRFMKNQGAAVKEGKSYLCRNVTNARGKIRSKPSGEECCLELAMAPDLEKGTSEDSPTAGAFLRQVESGLTAEYVRQVQNSAMAGKNDPAFRLQKFNGYSRLMGGAESVSVFRAGVNYFEDPAYGYQAMDYIVNSLMSNPWIRGEVERQSKELGIRNPSILCMDVKVPGTFQIDSDHYFKKHRDSDRMKVLQGKTWASMSGREKKVLAEEMLSPQVAEKLTKKFGSVDMVVSAAPASVALDYNMEKSPEGKSGELQVSSTVVKLPDGTGYEVLESFKGAGIGGGMYGKSSAQPFFKTEKVGSFSGKLPTSSEKTDPASYLDLSIIDQAKAQIGLTFETVWGKSTIKPFGGYTIDKAALNYLVSGWAQFPIPHKLIHKDGSYVEVSAPMKAGDLPVYTFFDKKGAPMAAPEYSFGQPVSLRVEFPDGKGLEYEQIIKIQSPSQSGAMGALSDKITTAIGYETGEKITITMATKTVKDPAYKAAAAPSDMPKVSVEQAVRYYLNDILPTRSTIARASTLPWTPMPDDKLKEISKLVRERSSRFVGVAKSVPPTPASVEKKVKAAQVSLEKSKAELETAKAELAASKGSKADAEIEELKLYIGDIQVAIAMKTHNLSKLQKQLETLKGAEQAPKPDAVIGPAAQ
jgi:hypothetical protein